MNAVNLRRNTMANPKFMKPVQPDADLAAIVGNDPLPRTEIIKKMWDYIKAKGLQDKVNKRNINGDEKLLKLFGKPQVTMFELAGIISKHVK